MLNLRRLKQDFSPAILKEGKTLYDKGMVVSIKIVKIKADTVRFSCRVMGAFDNSYVSEIEIDRNESSILDSDCDCTYKYDCQHLAAVLYYLESHYNEILVEYSKETDIEEECEENDEEEKAALKETIKEAKTKVQDRQGKKFQKELLEEYIFASKQLGQSPFFHAEDQITQDKAELAIIFAPPSQKTGENSQQIEIQLSLRLPFRSKSLTVASLKPFLDAVRYREAIYIGSKRFLFSLESFDEASAKLLKIIIDTARIPDNKGDKQQRSAIIDFEAFGHLLATSYDIAEKQFAMRSFNEDEQETLSMPCLYLGTIEEPLKWTPHRSMLRFELNYLEVPNPKILLKPTIVIPTHNVVATEDVLLFECTQPGMIYQKTYYRFPANIMRNHLKYLPEIRQMTIPEPLFGTFVENALPELARFAEVVHKEAIERFITLPFVEEVGAECDIHYLNGELEASLCFVYGNIKVPAASSQLTAEHLAAFVTPHGITARNLTEEQKIIETLFQDFIYESSSGLYITKNEKKIVEFMTEIIPANQHRVKFNRPENLLEQFIYDESKFALKLRETDRIDQYEVEIEVDGHLEGISVELLWDCISSKRAFIELTPKKKSARRKTKTDDVTAPHKILVLDLEKLAPVVQVFDELGINSLENHVETRPLWSLASIHEENFAGLPIAFKMTNRLKQIQKQMTGEAPHDPTEIPSNIKASFRNYQIEGIHWLDRLRSMHLNGILADDMGLGKTLQAITALTQHKKNNEEACSIVVCPTSLVYNWKEEFSKFNPKLKVLAIDGTPQQRKKLINEIHRYDVVVISYSLLQKDIEFYKSIRFGYVILDEAQNIKNRSTRNAQSVKMIQAAHRLILTGTPIENSLDELWSLFDFLMPGLLSSYDRFVEKYIRPSIHQKAAGGKNIDKLRAKVAPFILRRMKADVLQDLPPVSEIVYHCQLSPVQQELYHSYAASAREELANLVKKEGFERVQIHVLATLTRLKQICCHPAIFAKDKVELGDSSKYDMLLELLQNLMEGRHKTVIFSQYTRMLNIIRTDLQKQGIPFEYLDGTSKNRLSIVKKFNEDQNIPIFLVSLKAGGSGLNLVGADTVIHYDAWWNPAVENQATDRVHRMGQKNSVSSYKLITLNTIEEKIMELHQKKKSLVKEVISHDEDMMAKLTWEEVLELLQT